MTIVPAPISEDGCDGPRRDPARREVYSPPRLVQLGDLRTTCLGGSPGTGDSGSFETRFPPGVGPG